MATASLPPDFQRLATLDPALARSLSADFERLASTAEAVAWANGHLDTLLAAPGKQALLSALVRIARDASGATGVWAITWSGDAPTLSVDALSGDGAAVPPPANVSQTILGQVIRDGNAAWSDDARQEARFQAAQSVQAVSLQSVGCVPVGARGALYLDDPDRPARFGTEVRLRITALCAIAGKVLDAERASPAPPGVEPVSGLVGDAPAMREVVAGIHAFAGVPWPALVLGETGTGKEAIARALHDRSPRARHPFVAVNCASIPEALAESTLFGHERGAFTGADRRKDGWVDEVRQGTLFLDEVGELPEAVQPKLLRLLQEGTYRRVGGTEDLRFSGRVIAATHRALENSQGFRADLYYRLASCVIRVPPLRDRRADVPALAHHLLAKALAELKGAPALGLRDDAIGWLAAQGWPGNVRELQNCLRGGIARAIAADADLVTAAHLGGATPSAGPVASDLHAATDAFQRAQVHAALALSDGNRTEAANRLGVSRQWLHRLLSRWDEA